jgi:hypothetical protein
MYIPLEKFNVDKLITAETITKKIINNQYYSFISYLSNNKAHNFYLISDEFTLNGGTQKKNQYFPTDESRHFMNIKCNDEKDCMLLFQKLKDIDNYIINNQEKILCDLDDDKKYQYIPIVKEKNDNKFIRIKLDTDFETKMIKTKAYLYDNKKRDEIDVTTINNFEKNIYNNCKVRLVLNLSKIWINKNKIAGQKMYGITLRLMQIQFTPYLNKVICSFEESNLESDSEKNYDEYQEYLNDNSNETENSDEKTVTVRLEKGVKAQIIFTID